MASLSRKGLKPAWAEIGTAQPKLFEMLLQLRIFVGFPFLFRHCRGLAMIIPYKNFVESLGGFSEIYLEIFLRATIKFSYFHVFTTSNKMPSNIL